jgi:hypothetical protein
MAVAHARRTSSASGRANATRSAGRTSGTPPTRVETTSSPAHAASTSAIPNDSVRDAFRKMCPRTSTCLKVSQCRQVENSEAYITHVGRSDGAEELDAVLQQVLLPHLKDVDELRTVTTCTFVSSAILFSCNKEE